jgi:RNA polymerase sigma-70 factor (ECF subfamily)
MQCIAGEEHWLASVPAAPEREPFPRFRSELVKMELSPGAEFANKLIAALPNLRAFAISLTNDTVRADDLVQNTVLRAWANADRFQPGTNLTAWLFTILRNCFYSEFRKRMHEIEDPEGFYMERLRTRPYQHVCLEFEDLRDALAKLRPEHREVLILVGAEGMSYDDAAAICGMPVGTVKSRVHRARRRLRELLNIDDGADLGPDSVTMAAIQETTA